MTGLELFIQNPCFNKNKDIMQLFQYLKQFVPHYNDVDLTAENAFKEIYPNKEFKKSDIHLLMNKLFGVIKKFIDALLSTANQTEVELNTLIFCNQRHPDRFDNQLKKIRSTIDRNQKGSELYYYTFLAEYELSQYLAIHGTGRNYAALSEALGKFYWLKKLSLLAEMLNYKCITSNNGYNFSQLDIYMKFIKQIGYTKTPLIELWYCLVGIFKNILDKVPVDLQDYRRFKTSFFQNIDDLHPDEKRCLYIYLRNIVRLSSFEDNDYYKEEFEIDQLGLDEGLIFFNGYLREVSVKNIINSAIRVGETQWAKDFLHQYKDIFWRRFADDVLAYCKAVINFYEGKYNEVLALFTTVKYNNVFFEKEKGIFFEIEKRIKLVQIYYETKEEDLFYKEINNLTSYISRNQDKVGIIYAQSYRGFANFVDRISRIIRRDLDKIAKLETEIRKIPVRLLFEKKWLLEKLNELK